MKNQSLIRVTVSSILFLAIAVSVLLISRPALAASQRNLGVVDLTSNATPEQASQARTVFAKGEAIVRMVGGSPADFDRLVGTRAANIKSFSKMSRSPVEADSAAKDGMPLTVRGVAAYIDTHGVTHSVQALAPANNPGDGAQGWKQHLNDWVAHEQTNALAVVGDSPAPPSQAWTQLYQQTFQSTSGSGNYIQNTISIYRLNDTDPTNDYYMVYTAPEVIPAWGQPYNDCNGFDACDWHTISRHMQHDATPNINLNDHGPTGTIEGGSAGFTVGGNVPGGGFASFGVTWNQSDVDTTDHSTANSGVWDESFNIHVGPQCNPVGGGNNVPATSKGTFLSYQASIFQVAGGTSSVSFPVTNSAQFCYYETYVPGLGPNYETVTSQVTLSLGPPVLQPSSTELTIPAGGSTSLGVAAYIPGSSLNPTWTISSDQSWLKIVPALPSGSSYAGSKAIVLQVDPTVQNGTTATLSIDTSPSHAAPSVENGPISVPVTVGTPKAVANAGILLFGGQESLNAAEWYDLSKKTTLPVVPNTARPLYSTATLLNTGNILIAGGVTNVQSATVTAAAELYQPAVFSFSNTGTLATGRAAHTATLLPDGKVLIVGGFGADGKPLASAELYDPASGTFSSAGNLAIGRSYHTASLISGPGKPAQVLIYTGITTTPGVPDDGWELWDETKNAFVNSGKMAAGVFNMPQPVASPDGVLHLAGGIGSDGQTTAQEQLLNLSGPSFQFGTNLNVPRSIHTLTALPNGSGLLVTGGITTSYPYTTSTAEIRDSGGWTLLSGTAACPGSPGCMLTARSGHTATLLPDGTVFLVGGNTEGPSTEIYNPASKTFSAGPSLLNRTGHTATLVVTTATDLITTPPSSTFGQSVHLAAAVTSVFGTPTGTVRFLDGSTELGSAPLAQGQASIDVTTLSIGSHTLTAVYTGDGISSGSVSPAVTQVVSGATTSTSLSVSPNPSQFGSEVTLTASVSGTGGTVTGTVVFSDAGNHIASANLVNGSGMAKVSSLSVGQHPLTATYSTNGNWQGSTSATVVQTVTAVTVGTKTTLSSNNNPSTTGQSVTFQAQVSPISGSGAPTGTVNFLEGNTLLGSGNLVSGTAQFSTPSLTPGTHVIVASYGGDTNFAPSQSTPYTQTVSSPGGKVTPTVDLTVNGSSSNATVDAGATVTFVARIHAAQGYPWPDGSITISDSTNGANIYGSANISKDPNSNDGLATIVTTGIPVGSYSLVATYGGDNQGMYYNGARSNTVSLTVRTGLGGPPPQPSLSILATPGVRTGTLVPIMLTVTNNGTAPASSVTLNQIVLRTLAGTGQAVLVSPTLPLAVGSLQPGASTILTLELQVPTTVQKLSLVENGTFQDGSGTVHQFSPGQVVFP